jgi:hypothetical protein
VLLASLQWAYAAVHESTFTIIEKTNSENGDDDYRYKCSLGCAIDWNVDATSTLSSNDSRYVVNNLADSKLKTAWVEGKEGNGVGEKIIFTFPKNKWPEEIGSEVSFWGFRMVNGYIKNKETWISNGRVRKLKVYLNDKPQVILNVEDSMDIQETKFPTFYIHRGDRVSVEILDVFPGSKFPDTAITELEPLGAH